MRVKIRYPDLAILIEGDALPERLRVAAVQMMTEGPGSVLSAPDAEGKQAVDIEKARELAGLRRWLAAACLVDPKMSADELLTSGIPAEDIDLLASIAVRERNTDAVGVTLGVEPLSRWETFREAHRRHFGEPICGEGCPACEEVRGVFSTRRPMQV